MTMFPEARTGPPPEENQPSPPQTEMKRPYTGPVQLLTAIALCTGSWAWFDIRLARYFRQLDGTGWRTFWDSVTLAGQSEWYLVGGLAIFAILYRKHRHTAVSGLFLFSAVAVSGLVADLLKFIFGRARPLLLFDQGLFGCAGFRYEHAWTSFPSGHSATGLSVAITLSLLQPRFRPLFLVFGLAVAASRVILTQHYLSDVLAGSMLGAATTIILYQRYFRNALDEATIR